MIGRLNHIAIAVPDLAKASELYRTVMGAKVSAPKAQPAHGVTVVFVELPNTKIELLHPLGEKSPIANFLARNADGGIHHVCYEVEDIYAARDKLKAQGARVLGDGEPKIGAHDKPVLFLHPKDFTGTLIELEQVWEQRHELGDRPHGLSGDLVDDPVRRPAARRRGSRIPAAARTRRARAARSSCARRSSPRSSRPCSGSASISSTRRTSSASATGQDFNPILKSGC